MVQATVVVGATVVERMPKSVLDQFQLALPPL
jgi:hypothetical protein